MSIICGVIKAGTIAISSDTLSSYGSMTITAEHIKNSKKIYSVNKSIIGIVGWSAMSDAIEHLILHDEDLFQLNNRMDIYSTLKNLHKKLKDDYFIETKEDEDDQPVESTQLNALIANKNGLFEIGSYREVNQFSKFWAIGSGQKYALGAMQTLYSTKITAKALAEAGVKAAAEFDEGCRLPLNTSTLKLKSEQ